MDRSERETLAEKVAAAIEKAVDAHWAETNKSAIEGRAANVKARKKGIVRAGDQWTETYSVHVRHYGSYYGRNCEITMDGCKRKFDVTEKPDYAHYPAKGSKKWVVHMYDEGDGEITVTADHQKNMESAVQNCIVALLGHAYYNGE